MLLSDSNNLATAFSGADVVLKIKETISMRCDHRTEAKKSCSETSVITDDTNVSSGLIFADRLGTIRQSGSVAVSRDQGTVEVGHNIHSQSWITEQRGFVCRCGAEHRWHCRWVRVSTGGVSM